MHGQEQFHEMLQRDKSGVSRRDLSVRTRTVLNGYKQSLLKFYNAILWLRSSADVLIKCLFALSF